MKGGRGRGKLTKEADGGRREDWRKEMETK